MGSAVVVEWLAIVASISENCLTRSLRPVTVSASALALDWLRSAGACWRSTALVWPKMPREAMRAA